MRQDLRNLTQIDLQAQWRCHLGNLAIDEVMAIAPWEDWAIAPMNARQHLAWGKGQQVLWLVQRLVVPERSQGYPLRGLSVKLALTWWAESAQVFVNGQLRQEGDLFDCSTRVLLAPEAEPGMVFDVAVRLVSPGHDDGALVRSLWCYEMPGGVLTPCPEPSFVADELAVLQTYLTTFQPEQLPELEAAIAQVDWSVLPDREAFHRELVTLRDRLLPFSPWLKQRQIALTGHAHLDLAWLWAVEDTWKAAERTFESVLNLQKDFPELIFCHSTPALYEWVETHRPDLFARIQQAIANGTWEVVAGLWVEPELNLVAGESLVRQVLYGQRYTQEKFGNPSAIAWLPDCFGFSWQLPQILRQGGVEYFVTQKLRWNDSTPFPHDWFEWRSPDRTGILSLMSAPIGEGIDPVKMATHACQWEQKTGIPHTLWLPGVGDHGGGPTRDMLETARRWQQSPFFPQLQFSSVQQYLQSLPSPLPLSSSPPEWNSDLYLEFHRGCYTTHADQKQQNRQCERLLYQAELWSSLATLLAQRPYPHAELETAWKRVLFNQFHDILPGSSIPQVFWDANQEWALAEETGDRLLTEALEAIAQRIQPPAPPHPDAVPIVLFNSLTWARSEIVAIPLAELASELSSELLSAHHTKDSWEVLTLEGEVLPTQLDPPDQPTHLLFSAEAVPGVGYRLCWLVPSDDPVAIAPPPDTWVLENEQLRVTVDPDTGDLSSVWDKSQQREILSAAGNVLQAFQDEGQYWDAWNIDPQYARSPLPEATLTQISWQSWGRLRSRLRVVRQMGQSAFQQDYVLDANSPLLRVETTVDWQERHVLVKAAFPLTVTATEATCEIPCGAIARPTQPATPQEAAQWEVPALQWADLSQDDFGFSLLTDYKHGFDVQPSQLRLTLLRGACWPDPEADRGQHQFTYALYPHAGRWNTAHTVHQGYALNQPILVKPVKEAIAPHLPPNNHLLGLPETLILMAFKPTESDSGNRTGDWIVRACEAQGNEVELTWDTPKANLALPFSSPPALQPTNLLEVPQSDEPLSNSLAIHPWQIVTLKVQETHDSSLELNQTGLTQRH